MEQVQTAAPVDIRTTVNAQQLPAPDNRFPGWAAPMSDARLVTQYLPHCSQNIPAGRQFPTKAWMQHNGEELIRASRSAMATAMGSYLPFDNSVVPPPAMTVSCRPSECARTTTHLPGGIGLEREGDAAPELFGTFSMVGQVGAAPVTAARTSGTTRYEGGRNTPRGVGLGRTAI